MPDCAHATDLARIYAARRSRAACVRRPRRASASTCLQCGSPCTGLVLPRENNVSTDMSNAHARVHACAILKRAVMARTVAQLQAWPWAALQLLLLLAMDSEAPLSHAAAAAPIRVTGVTMQSPAAVRAPAAVPVPVVPTVPAASSNNLNKAPRALHMVVSFRAYRNPGAHASALRSLLKRDGVPPDAVRLVFSWASQCLC